MRNKFFELSVSPEALAEILNGRMARRAWRRREGAVKAAATVRKRTAERRREAHAKRDGLWNPRLLALPGHKVIPARMVAGSWYAVQDLYDLAPEYARKSVRIWTKQKMLDWGVVERTLNPGYDHEKAPGRQSEARYLYRLTDKGATLAAGWRKALGEG
jgi:hypothetical protein